MKFCSTEVNTSSVIGSKDLDDTLKINSSRSPIKQPSTIAHFFNKENESGVNNLTDYKSSSNGISSNEAINKVFPGKFLLKFYSFISLVFKLISNIFIKFFLLITNTHNIYI